MGFASVRSIRRQMRRAAGLPVSNRLLRRQHKGLLRQLAQMKAEEERREAQRQATEILAENAGRPLVEVIQPSVVGRALRALRGR